MPAPSGGKKDPGPVVPQEVEVLDVPEPVGVVHQHRVGHSPPPKNPRSNWRPGKSRKYWLIERPLDRSPSYKPDDCGAKLYATSTCDENP